MSATLDSRSKLPPLERKYADLDLVERALAAVLTLPKTPVGVPVRTGQFRDVEPGYAAELKSAQDAIGDSFTALKFLEVDRWEMGTICQTYLGRRDDMRKFQDSFALQVAQWAGTDRHLARRLELIDLLTEVRDGILAQLWIMELPPASDAPAAALIQSSSVPKPSKGIHWNQISDARLKLLACLAGKRLTAKELSLELGIVVSSVKSAIRPLKDAGIIGNVRGGGYYVAREPEGTPPAGRSAQP